MAPTAAMAMSAAISPYSIAVAARLLRKIRAAGYRMRLKLGVQGKQRVAPIEASPEQFPDP